MRLVPALLTAAAGFALSSCHRPPAHTEITVERPWVRLSAVPGNPSAAYFTLRTNDDPVALQTITSPQVGKIELHESRMVGGMMHMAPLATLQLPRSGVMEFKPGGAHAMLFNVDPTVKPGDRLSFTFTFQPYVQIETDAPVLAAGAPPPGGS